MVSDILELELLIVVEHHTVLEIEPGAFARTTNALNYCTTYLVPLELRLTSNLLALPPVLDVQACIISARSGLNSYY